MADKITDDTVSSDVSTSVDSGHIDTLCPEHCQVLYLVL